MVLPPEPVSMVRPEATATVVTVSAPLSAVALRLARRPSTVIGLVADQDQLRCRRRALAAWTVLAAAGADGGNAVRRVMEMLLARVGVDDQVAGQRRGEDVALEAVDGDIGCAASVRVLLSSSAAALTVTVSAPSVAAIEVLLAPVVTVLMLSAAPAMLTVSVLLPVTALALRSPASRLTVAASSPVSVST